jgi:hypothetical protein
MLSVNHSVSRDENAPVLLYENVSTIILDIIHRPVLYKHDISETGFCLRLPDLK